MKGYKGFDKDFRCQGFQFEIGKTYTHEGTVTLCESGFHFVTHPLDAFGYYPPASSRYAEIEAEGVAEATSDDTKRVCSRLRIVREMTTDALTASAVEQVFAQADWSSGAATASGERGIAIACGIDGTARGEKGAWIVLSEWKNKNGRWDRISVKAFRVDGRRIKPNIFYRLTNGKLVKV